MQAKKDPRAGDYNVRLSKMLSSLVGQLGGGGLRLQSTLSTFRWTLSATAPADIISEV